MKGLNFFRRVIQDEEDLKRFKIEIIDLMELFYFVIYCLFDNNDYKFKKVLVWFW